MYFGQVGYHYASYHSNTVSWIVESPYLGPTPDPPSSNTIKPKAPPRKGGCGSCTRKIPPPHKTRSPLGVVQRYNSETNFGHPACI
ncbi:hypothetical protein BDZ94DRAFT_1257533 [Collybia nuda]|uniref:Uncharacterized protein n=1 Tax=Collybia nuda TaxID=64659 RepID=A0A9P5Y8E2_9AGAR|nr:hypothetical protein BDZ94DRAFT_1257533 [Collybia nuda]